MQKAAPVPLTIAQYQKNAIGCIGAASPYTVRAPRIVALGATSRSIRIGTD